MLLCSFNCLVRGYGIVSINIWQTCSLLLILGQSAEILLLPKLGFLHNKVKCCFTQISPHTSGDQIGNWIHKQVISCHLVPMVFCRRLTLCSDMALTHPTRVEMLDLYDMNMSHKSCFSGIFEGYRDKRIHLLILLQFSFLHLHFHQLPVPLVSCSTRIQLS